MSAGPSTTIRRRPLSPAAPALIAAGMPPAACPALWRPRSRVRLPRPARRSTRLPPTDLLLNADRAAIRLARRDRARRAHRRSSPTTMPMARPRAPWRSAACAHSARSSTSRAEPVRVRVRTHAGDRRTRGGYAAGLIVTVDNGIASVDGVAAANRLGIDVLVTDHHLPGAALPDACCIVNPNQAGCAFPCKHIAGVGVMFYVLLALRQELRRRNAPQAGAVKLATLLDLVALGTVADVVRLDATNRIMVGQGLARIRGGAMQPGRRRAVRRGRTRSGARDDVRARFLLGPRINAAGRLADMSLGIRCLVTDDPDEARDVRATARPAEPRPARDRIGYDRRGAGAARRSAARRRVDDHAVPAPLASGCRRPARVAAEGALAPLLIRIALLLWFSLGAAAFAHEIRPAVVTVTFAPPAYEIEISANLEAMLAGVSPQHADTSESPNAKRYDSAPVAAGCARIAREGVRAGARSGTRRRVRRNARGAGARRGPGIPEVGDVKLARISVLRLRGRDAGRREGIPVVARARARRQRAADPRSRAATRQVSIWLKNGEWSDPFVFGKGVRPRSAAQVVGQYARVRLHAHPAAGLDHILFVLGSSCCRRAEAAAAAGHRVHGRALDHAGAHVSAWSRSPPRSWSR